MAGLARLGVSRPGFDGDLEARMMSWRKEMLRGDGETTKVPGGVVGSGCSARVRVGAADRACGQGPRSQLSEELRKRVRRAEAANGTRPDLPTTAEREEIRKLRREVYELRRANEILKSASV